MGVGLALAPDEIVPSAFAETVTATVMPGQVAPVSLGTSLVFDMAYPEAPGEPGLHLVKRLWMRGIDERQWSDLPTDVTFVLQTSADGVGYYLAENWPFDKGYQLVVVQPDSPSCHGDGMPSGAAEEPTLMISTMLRLCQRPSSLATPGLTPVTVDSGFAFTGTGWSTVTDAIEISATTTDPVTVLDQVRQFSFGSDGRLVAAPAGYDDWLHRLDTQAFMGDYSCGSGDAQPIPDPPAPGTVLTHGSWGFPSLANTKPTKTNEDIVVGVWVDEDGVCTVKEGADRLDQAGITLGADGACSYTP
jgi:hypothetical protein